MNILTGQDSNEGDHCQSSPYIVIIFNLPGGIDYYIFSHWPWPVSHVSVGSYWQHRFRPQWLFALIPVPSNTTCHSQPSMGGSSDRRIVSIAKATDASCERAQVHVATTEIRVLSRGFWAHNISKHGLWDSTRYSSCKDISLGSISKFKASTILIPKEPSCQGTAPSSADCNARTVGHELWRNEWWLANDNTKLYRRLASA